jgi:molybdopterin-binding protein
MDIPRLFSPDEAAKILGVSYSTLKQFIYKKKLRSVKTAGGHHRIPEPELDKFLHRVPARLPVSERRLNFRRISGRTSGLIAQVRISTGGQHITSVIAADAVREMQLKVGDTVAVLIKATEVMIAARSGLLPSVALLESALVRFEAESADLSSRLRGFANCCEAKARHL